MATNVRLAHIGSEWTQINEFVWAGSPMENSSIWEDVPNGKYSYGNAIHMEWNPT